VALTTRQGLATERRVRTCDDRKDSYQKISGIPRPAGVLNIMERTQMPTFEWDQKAFGCRLRTLRVAMELTEHEAAEIARCNVRTWRRHEAGERCHPGPVYTFLRKLHHRRYEINWNWLFDGGGSPYRSAKPRLRLVQSA
jgi:hypothetical protein